MSSMSWFVLFVTDLVLFNFETKIIKYRFGESIEIVLSKLRLKSGVRIRIDGQTGRQMGSLASQCLVSA